jgi:putative spermidine/putrescine transport system permease protein
VVRWLLYVLTFVVLMFLIAPVLVVVPMSLSTSPFLQFPPPGFGFQWYEAFFDDPRWTNAIVLSAKVAVGATIVAVTIGTAAAYALVRRAMRGSGPLQALLTLPLVIPAIVYAVGLYLLSIQFDLVGSMWVLITAHGLLALPFVVLNVSAGLRTTDRRLELVAQTLGASPFNAFRLVTLPLIAPALFASALITLILSLDETVVALFVTADTEPTLPVQVYNSIRYELDPKVPVAATVVIAGSVVVGMLFLLTRWSAVKRSKLQPEFVQERPAAFVEEAQ